jgi:hypothetical protein
MALTGRLIILSLVTVIFVLMNTLVVINQNHVSVRLVDTTICAERPVVDGSAQDAGREPVSSVLYPFAPK